MIEPNKTRDNRLIEAIQWAREELKKLEWNKQRIIIKLAKRLEIAGILHHTICAEISKGLEGYVTRRYVEQCLDDKYKRPRSPSKESKIVIEDMRNISHFDKKVMEQIPIQLANEGIQIYPEVETEKSKDKETFLADKATPSTTKPTDNVSHLLFFKVCISSKYALDYIFLVDKDNQICISGTIDIRTGEVISPLIELTSEEAAIAEDNASK